MKNLIKFFMVLAVWCAVTACSQTTEGKQEATKGRLVMNVRSESRTIMPEINENDIKSATLTANEDEIKSWSGADVISQLESDNSILLDTGIYDFEMTFCNENGDVILKGVIENQEIVAGDNSLVFNMKLVQGKGNIAIELTWEAISGISKIKAGLYDIATCEAVAGYEAEEIVINEIQAEYAKNDVPTGQYIIKFEVYDTSDKLLNTLTDVIKVTNGLTATEQKTLDKVNTQYTITYDLAGGSWKSEFTPVTVRNANMGITLSTADNIERADYDFVGWYDENGDKVTQIPSDTAKDISVTAKWNSTDFVYVQGATITGAITADGYTTSYIFKDGVSIPVCNFYICDHEVTQTEYEKYCSYGGTKPSETYGVGNNYPAYYVSWYDALVYCNKRSMDEGLTPCYTINDSTNPDDWGDIPTSSDSTWNAVTCDFTKNGYRLPTEAEWEYAARGGNGLTGTQYKYAGSDTIDDVAWYSGNSEKRTHPVKTKEANGLGLYDMSGNVLEWCWDSSDSGYRNKRGGTWGNSSGFCTMSSRSDDYAYNRININGFRVVRTAK
ncbi:MAG: SUMF1/EgtB/PvdO family nonheme iron enzyme [Spirochaetota bacterium]|nr:SUMF1/EgtB/PvdO family nonheme iron enzyme [Spirochaetota bacterium]